MQHCITLSFEHDHNISSVAVDLLKIQRSDVTVEFQCLGYGGVHVALTQVWCVVSDPVKAGMLLFNKLHAGVLL